MHHMVRKSFFRAINDYSGSDPHPFIVVMMEGLTDDEVQELREARRNDLAQRRQGDSDDNEFLEALLDMLTLDDFDDFTDPSEHVSNRLHELFEIVPIGVTFRYQEKLSLFYFICADEEASRKLHDLMWLNFPGITFSYEVTQDVIDLDLESI